jgi:hypothetical protein
LPRLMSFYSRYERIIGMDKLEELKKELKEFIDKEKKDNEQYSSEDFCVGENSAYDEILKMLEKY